MHYPQLDPIAFSLGPVQVRWYGLMYLLAFATCFLLGSRRAARAGFSREDLTDLIFHGVVGVVIGGRTGFVLVYGWEQFIDDPLWLLRLWEGGMSFHGGLGGVAVAMAIWARRKGRTWLSVVDFVVPLVPLGLGLGRIGNFINTELPGRVTESALGAHFPCWAVQDHTLACFGEFETVTRHVSSLYQAFAEGLALFAIVWVFSARDRRPGAVVGMFMLSYGCLRFATEFFRAPDAHLGLIGFGVLSVGQLLSLPMMASGIFLLLLPRAASK